MTGTPSFKSPFAQVPVCWILATTFSFADVLTMTKDSHLSGNVRSIGANGGVELASEFSRLSIQVSPGAVEKIDFSGSKATTVQPTSILELINGDLLPITEVGLMGDIFNVETSSAGALAIPRALVKSLQMGVQRQKVLYRGPNSIEEWNREVEGARNWQFADKNLVANGPAVAAMKVDLPLQFVMKCKIEWMMNPNFHIYLADPQTPKAERMDRYILRFDPNGIELRRESATGNRFHSIISLPRQPDQFPNKVLDLVVRVDRKSSRFHLSINGEPEASGMDLVEGFPKGTGVVLVNNAPAGFALKVKSLEILDFDNPSERHRSEDRGDVELDSLISRADDRWGGKLIEIKRTDSENVLLFKSGFQAAPLELTEKDVSTVFFAASRETLPAEKSSFLLRLPDSGALQVTSCIFENEEVHAIHPLLGKIKLDRKGIVAMERVAGNLVKGAIKQ